MKVVQTAIPEVLIFEPKVFSDNRGFFFECYQQKFFDAATGYPVSFVQDNHSGSQQNVLRGLHYQVQQAQGKLIRVIAGAIYDVAVDIRQNSSTFGKYVGAELSSENKRMLWIPEGFAHGFLTLASWNEVYYKATSFYAPAHERSIRWDDPEISVDWPLNDVKPIVSGKDEAGAWLRDAELF
ncbi:MAG TPA: dTDP-4-dehydrorhamnose 3,5-epimerase [Bryobacteraceae bacterium]|jgi:dTDP-4-dehydrorhamnose 3,5-epimerase|nr:dTDP-4-dehydrorhamnose 3,5-epimerase [Bryobacteraceae bacterium]